MKSGPAIHYRMEGFVGQRLVVLPPAVVESSRRHSLLMGLLPTAAGFFGSARGHLVERDNGAPEHVIIVCLAGEGWYRLGKSTGGVLPGDVLLLPPNTRHAYGAAEETPWSIEWAHFTGTEAAGWREALALAPNEGVVSVGARQAGEIRLGQVHPFLEKGYDLPNLLAASASLRLSLAELLRRREMVGWAEPARIAVAHSIERMRESLDKPKRLAEVAAEAGLSVSHYSTVFRAQTGFSPIDYFIRMRMQRAAQLLDTTEMRVEEIAATVGYADPYHFSRQFRRLMRRSPRAYRAVRKG